MAMTPNPKPMAILWLLPVRRHAYHSPIRMSGYGKCILIPPQRLGRDPELYTPRSKLQFNRPITVAGAYVGRLVREC